MLVLSKGFAVKNINTTDSQDVPRTTLISDNVSIAVDCNSSLLFLRLNDDVKVELSIELEGQKWTKARV